MTVPLSQLLQILPIPHLSNHVNLYFLSLPVLKTNMQKKMTINLNLKKNKAQGTHTHTKPTNIQLEP